MGLTFVLKLLFNADFCIADVFSSILVPIWRPHHGEYFGDKQFAAEHQDDLQSLPFEAEQHGDKQTLPYQMDAQRSEQTYLYKTDDKQAIQQKLFNVPGTPQNKSDFSHIKTEQHSILNYTEFVNTMQQSQNYSLARLDKKEQGAKNYQPPSSVPNFRAVENSFIHHNSSMWSAPLDPQAQVQPSVHSAKTQYEPKSSSHRAKDQQRKEMPEHVSLSKNKGKYIFPFCNFFYIFRIESKTMGPTVLATPSTFKTIV